MNKHLNMALIFKSSLIFCFINLFNTIFTFVSEIAIIFSAIMAFSFEDYSIISTITAFFLTILTFFRNFQQFFGDLNIFSEDYYFHHNFFFNFFFNNLVFFVTFFRRSKHFFPTFPSAIIAFFSNIFSDYFFPFLRKLHFFR